MDRRLYRSNTNKVIGGVCGGLGEYFDIDPVLIRVIMVLLALPNGLGLIAYIIGWIIIPKRPPEVEYTQKEYHFSSWNKYLPGIILIGIGAILLMREHWYWFDLGEFWPVILVVVGLVMIFRKGRNNREAESPSPNDSQTGTDVNHNGGTLT